MVVSSGRDADDLHMIFDWRLGVACWVLAAFFLGFGLASDAPHGGVNAFVAFVSFGVAGALQFLGDWPSVSAADDSSFTVRD